MRLFVAVELPDPVRTDLAAALDVVRRETDVAVRWGGPARWHLTLAFLGDVAEPAYDRLLPRLGRVAGRHPAVRLQVSGAGRFDGRVLWVGLDGGTAQLVRLAAAVAAQARHAGIAVEARPYRPHVTVARAARPTDLRPLVAALTGYRGPSWLADTVQLVRSTQGPDPRYETLAAWPLGNVSG